MEGVKATVGYKGTLPEFFKHLQDDPRYKFTSREEMLAAYREAQARIDRLRTASSTSSQKRRTRFDPSRHSASAVPRGDRIWQRAPMAHDQACSISTLTTRPPARVIASSRSFFTKDHRTPLSDNDPARAHWNSTHPAVRRLLGIF